MDRESETNTMEYIGKICIERFVKISEDITTDEVILTEKQIVHIKDRHPNDYELYFKYFKEIIEEPDYIIRDANPNTGILLKRILTEEKDFQLILRLHTSYDNPRYKNSIITFMKIGKKRYNQYIRNKEVVWKRLDKEE